MQRRHKIDYWVKHVHLPRSIWAAKATFGTQEALKSKINVDVDQCAGCCYGPLALRATTHKLINLPMPGFMETDINFSRVHELVLDGIFVFLLECASQEIALGDYGNWDHESETFTRDGNIFEDLELLARTPGTNLMNSAYRPVERTIPQFFRWGDHISTSVVKGSHSPLAMRQPIGYSLPTSRKFTLLLKSLSTRINNRYIVTTIVQCSAYHAGDPLQIAQWIAKDGTEQSKSHSATIDSQKITVLCDIAKPQAWDRDATDKERREQYKEIRQKFSVLLDSVLFAAGH